ncbi:MAG: 16S rRNA (guanine(527)-N(7))-methyltransferase RsmG [Candidatus Limnocylindria bacterium]
MSQETLALSKPFASLRGEAQRLSLTLGAAQLALCERYADELIAANTSVNLTAITRPEDIAHKHFLDSFTALAIRNWSAHERLVDVGSGAGFPGLALRIARPDLRVTLVESVAKKTRFLEALTQTLGLGDVEIRNERAEVTGRGGRRAGYDVATARAVGSLAACVEYLLPLLRVGGDAIVWKGRLDEELPAGRRALAAVGGELVAVVPTANMGAGDLLPGRHLVIMRKTRPTPDRFPRAAAQATRRPW